jgi:hypothetical protein
MLFDSVGKVFGEFCVAVILSGMGCDVARGAGTVKARGGAVFLESLGNLHHLLFRKQPLCCRMLAFLSA